MAIKHMRLLLASPIWGVEWPVYGLARLALWLDRRLQRLARGIEGTSIEVSGGAGPDRNADDTHLTVDFGPDHAAHYDRDAGV